MPIPPVGAYDLYPPKSCFCQALPCARRGVFVNVNCRDLPGLANHVRHQGRVISGSGADLQNLVTGFETELLQHHDELRAEAPSFLVTMASSR
jgi:hypothetical protein